MSRIGFWVNHILADGNTQMALDEALLTWAQQQPGTPMLICRTYCWTQPTLSFGVHQKCRDAEKAWRFYSMDQTPDIVIRPTGGRAILHGKDVSFAFITNDPALLKLSLNDSYCVFTKWVRAALESCNIPLQTACTQDEKAYIRSPLCFETYTPSDLATPQGQKVAGSAQLRRHGGILQHGAAFLETLGVSPAQFDAALHQQVSESLTNGLQLLNPQTEPTLKSLWENLTTRYASSSAQMSAKLLTTSGSHLEPASD